MEQPLCVQTDLNALLSISEDDFVIIFFPFCVHTKWLAVQDVRSPIQWFPRKPKANSGSGISKPLWREYPSWLLFTCERISVMVMVRVRKLENILLKFSLTTSLHGSRTRTYHLRLQITKKAITLLLGLPEKKPCSYSPLSAQHLSGLFQGIRKKCKWMRLSYLPIKVFGRARKTISSFLEWQCQGLVPLTSEE